MKTNIPNILTDDERAIISNKLGLKGLLSRKQVNELVEGFFAELKLPPENEIVNEPIVNKSASAIISEKDYPPLLTKKIEEYKLQGISEAEIAGRIRGWLKPSTV
tara:strand:+ start:178 stop:492 length:315 start_codon:yes stop_codon:yes gene_type:complete